MITYQRISRLNQTKYKKLSPLERYIFEYSPNDKLNYSIRILHWTNIYLAISCHLPELYFLHNIVNTNEKASVSLFTKITGRFHFSNIFFQISITEYSQLHTSHKYIIGLISGISSLSQQGQMALNHLGLSSTAFFLAMLSAASLFVIVPAITQGEVLECIWWRLTWTFFFLSLVKVIN